MGKIRLAASVLLLPLVLVALVVALPSVAVIAGWTHVSFSKAQRKQMAMQQAVRAAIKAAD